jgi:rhodanese-related sulfurtransferase
VLAAWVGWKYWQRKRFLRSLAIARITPEELRAMLESGEEVVVVDVRSPLESEQDTVPGALRIPLEEMEQGHGAIPRDRDIVLFCS